MLHGFTGTPFEMRYLGERLHRDGFTVVGPTLPGHGTAAGELDRTGWPDWYAGVEAAADELARRCDRIAVVGQSLGGLLALHLAARRPELLTAVAALATPLWLPAAARAVVRLVRRAAGPDPARCALLPKPGGSDIRDRAMGAANPAYPQLPLARPRRARSTSPTWCAPSWARCGRPPWSSTPAATTPRPSPARWPSRARWAPPRCAAASCARATT